MKRLSPALVAGSRALQTFCFFLCYNFRSCVYEAIGQRSTVASAGATPLYNTLRGAGIDYETRKLAALQVTEE